MTSLSLRRDHQGDFSMARLKLQPLGETCLNEECRSADRILRAADNDHELQAVANELSRNDLAAGFTDAIESSIAYVLDGARTWRFDLLGSDVHPGERASVGAKLEYEAQRVFDWKKAKPLDVEIGGVPVDLKTTVGDNWAIPTEAHCHLCICTKIELKKNRHRSWLIRTHTSWLYRGKGNKDGKRGIAVDARHQWGLPLYDWTNIPINPLTRLTEEQAAMVFEKGKGQEVRLLRMFHYLPKTVISRSAILTVCAGNQDPMRRARAIRPRAEKEGLLVLCGTWLDERAEALRHGFALGSEDWVALPLNSTPQPEPANHDRLF
ncbi:NaeI family type II restriction endonuclease [Kitasatospora sp. NPDC048365]|uniref:NaeI family type II restriction endonuclease n=1 Tax=Kitasatospora sp. NPDC048365 TaxID=3364050 RepID=UPI00371F5077